MPRIKYIVIFGSILLLALALRLYNLGRHNLWYDEAVTALAEWGLDKLPSPDKLLDADYSVGNKDYLTIYSHGFVYYWQRLFKDSEAALRSSSVVFSALGICLLFLLGKEVFGSLTAYLAIFLLSISPFNIYQSQELRPYAALSFFTLLAAYSFVKMLKGNKKRYFFIYAISNILNIYFHCSAILAFFSFSVFFVLNLKKYRRHLKRFLITNAVIIILLLPVFLSLYHKLAFISRGAADYAYDPEFGSFPSTWAGKADFMRLFFTFKNFTIGYNTDYLSFFSIIGVLVYFYFFLLGANKFYKKAETKLFLACLFLPAIALFLISQFKTLYVDRYLSYLFPFYILIIASGLSRLRKKAALVVTIFIIVIFNSSGLKNYYSYFLPGYHIQLTGVASRPDAKNAARIISEDYNKNDVVLNSSRCTVFPLKFYIRQFTSNPDLSREVNKGSVIFIRGLPKGRGLYIYDYKEPFPNLVLLKDFKQIALSELPGRVWLVFSDWYFQDALIKKSAVVEELRGSFKEEKCIKLDGLYLYLFIKNNLGIKKK